MRGIFWWNRKMDRSREAMELSTSPFQREKKKKRLRKRRKRKSEYPEIHRHVNPDEERIEAPSTEVVGIVVVLICIGLIVVFLTILAFDSPLYTAMIVGPPAAVVAVLGIRWKLRHKTHWKKRNGQE
jgi:Flp pilus assembly protein TadB